MLLLLKCTKSILKHRLNSVLTCFARFISWNFKKFWTLGLLGVIPNPHPVVSRRGRTRGRRAFLIFITPASSSHSNLKFPLWHAQFTLCLFSVSFVVSNIPLSFVMHFLPPWNVSNKNLILSSLSKIQLTVIMCSSTTNSRVKHFHFSFVLEAFEGCNF